MAFTIRDMPSLTRVLIEHPEWRAEVRRLVLSEELLTLPEVVRELADAQKRTEQRVEELAQAQARTEQRVEELAQAQARTEQRVEELAQAQARTEQRVQELVEAQKHNEVHFKRLDDKVSRLEGWAMEEEYRKKASGYFGGALRKVRVVPQSDLEDTLRARLTPEEVLDVFRLDLLVNGIVDQGPPEFLNLPLWLAVEVSATIDREDVARARRRAEALRKAGYPCIPAVAGASMTDGAAEQVQILSVATLTDGQVAHWDQALQRWSAAPADNFPPS